MYYVDGENTVFNFIVNYKIQNDGASPTLREIMEGTMYQSTSAVKYVLSRLSDQGRISLREFKFRGITVVGGGWSYKPPEL